MKSKFKISLIFIFITVIAIAGSLIVPQFLLKRIEEKSIDTLYDAPEGYYKSTNSAVARENSKNLSSLDLIKLFYGSWESTYEECDTNEGFLSCDEAVELAKQSIEKYYELGIYPYSLISSGKNWYSWNAKLYKFTDATFKTYTAYLWVITFKKYDGSLEHKIAITENGVILNAEVNTSFKRYSRILSAYNDKNLARTLNDSSLSSYRFCATDELINKSPYPDVNLENYNITSTYKITICDTTNNDEYYYIYQYNSGTSHYGFGIQPNTNVETTQ